MKKVVNGKTGIWGVTFLTFLTFATAWSEPVDLKIGMLGQIWGDHDLQASSTWSLRRAQLSIGAKPAKDDPTDIFMMIDPVSVPGNVIQELYLQYRLSDLAGFRVGQFKIPFGNEGLRPSHDLDFIERARIMTSTGLGERRDIGAMLSFAWKPVTISVGAFNGSGRNTPDTNPSKDTVARVTVPLIASKGNLLRVGASGYLGLDNDRQSFWAGGADLEWTIAGSMIGRVEYARGRLGSATGLPAAEVEGWQLALMEPPSEKTQLAVRLEEYVPTPGTWITSYHAITIGLNYFITDHTKIQFNGSRSGVNDIWKFDTSLIRFNFQAHF